ncbi:ribonuclease H-like domain-containing protein [Chloroflexota bacterium]
MQPCYDAYLDIETTGLSPWDNEITVIGIHLCNGTDERFIQLIGDSVTEANILRALDGVHTIYTYNGHRFDLPFIYSRLKVNLARLFKHHDLMFDCWRSNLYGGFKSVERQLGISRKLIEVNGYEAVRLWWRYVNDYDEEALNTLLEYNKEDVMNLRCLKEKLLLDYSI